MVMASWNGYSWECNGNVMSYLESLTTSFAIETQSNADKDGKSPTETVGISPIEISFTTAYRVETGTKDVRGIMNAWKSMVGKAAPLIIGTEVFGADMMQLQSVSFSDIGIRSDGFIRSCKVSFKFKEYVESKKKVKASNTGSSTNSTALNIGPTTREKAKKKTYSDIKAEQTRTR